MPSDFEREYKKYIESDMPDLWSRIEAGIEADEPIAAQTADEPTAAQTADEKTDNKKIIRWGVFAKRAGQIAAAIALVFVAYALVQFMTKGGMRASESTAPMADAAAEAPAMEAEAPAAAEAEAVAEAAEAADEYYDLEGAAAEAAPADNAMEAEAPVSLGTDSGQYKSSDKTASLKPDIRGAEEAAEAEAEEADEIYPESVELESAQLIDMTEIAPAERVTSASGTQYKLGLTFETDDMTVYCLISEDDIKKYAEQGIHLKKGESYKVDVVLRDDVAPADSKYPYLLKTIGNVK